MADVTQTAVDVKIMEQAVTLKVVQAGAAATITQGDQVYQHADGRYKLGDADDLVTAASKGIALTPAGNDGWFVLVTGGLVDIGGTLDVNTEYLASGTAGKFMPASDLANPQLKTSMGSATTVSILDLKINVSGIVEPV